MPNNQIKTNRAEVTATVSAATPLFRLFTNSSVLLPPDCATAGGDFLVAGCPQ